MREGLEGEGEKIFHGAQNQQGRLLPPVKGRRCGGEELQHLYTERQRGKGWMVSYGGCRTGFDR